MIEKNDVAERLRARALGAELPSVLILPSQLRDGRWLYSETDLEALKVARSAGVDAEYLDVASDRRYLAEYSSGLVLDLALAVAANLSADGLLAVGRYVLAQIEWLRNRGLVAPSDDIEVSIRAQVLEVTDQRFYAESLEVTANGRSVVPELLRLLQRGPVLDEALQRLADQEPLRFSEGQDS